MGLAGSKDDTSDWHSKNIWQRLQDVGQRQTGAKIPAAAPFAAPDCDAATQAAACQQQSGHAADLLCLGGTLQDSQAASQAADQAARAADTILDTDDDLMSRTDMLAAAAQMRPYPDPNDLDSEVDKLFSTPAGDQHQSPRCKAFLETFTASSLCMTVRQDKMAGYKIIPSCKHVHVDGRIAPGDIQSVTVLSIGR